MRRHHVLMCALLTVTLPWSTPLVAQQSTGTIRGRITDNNTQQPVAGAAISVAGRSALTQPDGRYVVTGVPLGPASVTARIVGYAPGVQPVNVTEGDALVVDIALTAQAINLAEIVVTGYGEQRAGNITGAVTQVNAEKFNPGRVVSPEMLIQSKIPGVQVGDNNEPGGGISIRVRGPTSVDIDKGARSDPLYVV